MYIQYMVPGFEFTTPQTRVVSINHKTRASVPGLRFRGKKSSLHVDFVKRQVISETKKA